MSEQKDRPELAMKAVSVIEGSLLLDEPEDKRLGFIYRMAHVGRGECEHSEWIKEMEHCYQHLLEDEVISAIPEKLERPELRDILIRYGDFMSGNDMSDDVLDIDEALALFPDIEEAKREERERVMNLLPNIPRRWSFNKTCFDCVEAIKKQILKGD